MSMRRWTSSCQLIERWHEDVQRHIDIENAIASTDGYSFAEIEELKNLLVMHYMDTVELGLVRSSSTSTAMN